MRKHQLLKHWKAIHGILHTPHQRSLVVCIASVYAQLIGLFQMSCSWTTKPQFVGLGMNLTASFSVHGPSFVEDFLVYLTSLLWHVNWETGLSAPYKPGLIAKQQFDAGLLGTQKPQSLSSNVAMVSPLLNQECSIWARVILLDWASI